MRTAALTWSYSIPFDAGEKLASVGNPLAGLFRSGGGSSAVLPGDRASAEALDRANDLALLLSLISRFAVDGLSWEVGQLSKITSMTASTASAFFAALPANKRLPKIAPDGEGGLMAIWEKSPGPLLLTVDDSRLHAVIAATTKDAEYLDDTSFDLVAIPTRILSEIPSR